MVFKRFCKDNKGFTLIEVMAVVAVSAILLMIIWPRAPLLSRWKLETAAQDLAGDLRLIRQAAITTGKSCEIAFFVYTNSYRRELPDKTSQIYLPEGIVYKGDTSFKGDPPFVHFNLMGRPSSGGTVILKSPTGEKRYIIVTPVTGRIRISKTQPDHW
ncbi:MAG: prepilin-type N-terminal cleavage/methylation domain-containing protein [Firmicutes bacterium]|nr:prepilin-type N-terminal cleavage/methylation domain-containing protein [Bacillota bacterium]